MTNLYILVFSQALATLGVVLQVLTIPRYFSLLLGGMLFSYVSRTRSFLSVALIGVLATIITFATFVSILIVSLISYKLTFPEDNSFTTAREQEAIDAYRRQRELLFVRHTSALPKDLIVNTALVLAGSVLVFSIEKLKPNKSKPSPTR